MFSLTVGQVSGIIAAITTALQLLFPTALALLIVGVLKDDMSAVTWSSVGATLHSSYWATMLRADTAVSTNVQRSVRWLLRLASVTMLLIALASIITPLGLSDTIEPSDSLQDVSFPYLADNGPFGYGTPPRDDIGFSRQCGIPIRAACPGSDTVEVKPEGDFISSDFPFGYNSRIPQAKIDLFQSGVGEQMQTVSSFFDIQYRAVSKQQDPDVNNGSLFNAGSYRQVGTLILDENVEAIEGLIVDTANKGVAFRNHTIPSGIPLGAIWEEDLLVMEPETQCVDTNLTIDFIISGLNGTFGGSAKSPVLTDRGGFANINHEFPFFDTSTPQTNPDLNTRAYLGAWAFNVMTAIYYNVTRPKPDRFAYLNSEVGKTYFMPESSLLHVDQLNIGSYSDLFSFLEYDNNSFISDNSSAPAPWANPFEITSSNYSDIAEACAGFSGANSNMSGVAVGCGLIYGAPRLAEGNTALFYDPGTKLSMPIYSCASAAKVSIKTYSLRYNGTQGLKSLYVDSIRDQSDAEQTYWGIENNNARSDLDIGSAPPIWGLVSSDTKPSKDLNVVQSSYLYLPGHVDNPFTALSSIGSDNLPAAEFYTDALGTIYNAKLGDSVYGIMDYSGKFSFALYAQWQRLMANATSSARIVDLIFTDLAANGLVGTKSWLDSSNIIPGGDNGSGSAQGKVKRQSTTGTVGSPAPAKVPVRVYTRRIQYNYLFGIPAYISVFIAALIGTLTLLYLLTGRTSFSKTRHYLHATSPGRIMSSFLYPGEAQPQIPSRRWVRGVGAKKIRISQRTDWKPIAAEKVVHPEKVSGMMLGSYGHGPVSYTGHGGGSGNAVNLPGYENDLEPLIDAPGKNAVGIQMTPLASSSPGIGVGVVPGHGGFQQQQQNTQYGGGGGGFQFGPGHAAAQQGAYPMSGYAR